MTTTITFLKQYVDVSYKLRYLTAKNYYETLLSSNNSLIKKLMVLRITDELIASTEDVAMWVSACNARKSPTKKSRDIWEYLLGNKLSEQQINDSLKIVNRLRTSRGFLKKFNFPNIATIEKYSGLPAKLLDLLMVKSIEAIRTCLVNRTAKNGLLVRFHNKVKHGMMVLEDVGGFYIRDLEVKTPNNRRVVRLNKNMFLGMDIDKAKAMLGTIDANSHTVQVLASLVLYDVVNELNNKKLTKRDLNFVRMTSGEIKRLSSSEKTQRNFYTN